MKYVQILSKLILCLLLSAVLVSLTFLIIFRLTFKEQALIDNSKNQKFITSQKTKVEQDLGALISSNNLDAALFENAVTEDLILRNNEGYLTGTFSYITGKSAEFPVATPAADEFENTIKSILTAYGDRVDPDRYQITEAGINSFASLAKSSFSYSAVPILGFSEGAKLLRIVFAYTVPAVLSLLIAVLLMFLLLLFVDRKDKLLAVAFFLYSLSASGILLSLISGYGLSVFSSPHSIFSPSYLGMMGKELFTVSLSTGIAMFAVTQICLFLLFSYRKKRR